VSTSRTVTNILELLRDFYGRDFRDELLGAVFVVAGMDLDVHLPVIADFWDTVLFHAGGCRRNALAPTSVSMPEPA
jgi:hemoglobin